MLTVISPAKKLDWSPVDTAEATEPAFLKDANALARTARGLSSEELQKLMKISASLADLNAERFKAFKAKPTDEAVKPAALAFNGDTYAGLRAPDFDAATMAYAQDHLRILSGLYGLLRPLDKIQPYRLEMGSRLETKKGKSLYEYWGPRLAKALNAAAAETGGGYLLNCASQEYFGAVDRKALKLAVIEPVFLEEKDGDAKVVSFFAKRARGAMARFVMENRIEDPFDLRAFDLDGYRFRDDGANDGRLVFTRTEAAAKAA